MRLLLWPVFRRLFDGKRIVNNELDRPGQYRENGSHRWPFSSPRNNKMLSIMLPGWSVVRIVPVETRDYNPILELSIKILHHYDHLSGPHLRCKKIVMITFQITSILVTVQKESPVDVDEEEPEEGKPGGCM